MGGSHSSHPTQPASRRTSHNSNNGNGGHYANNGSVDMRKSLSQTPVAVAQKGGGNRRPLPGEEELERRFNEVLIQMDLPPERAKHLR